MTDKLLYAIPRDKGSFGDIIDLLDEHPEVKFVSLVGLDIGGHDTDEKIPVGRFKDDIEKYLTKGVQTDGSSVVLPNISELNDAKVDIIPDLSVRWFVDYNFDFAEGAGDSSAPVGTLRIPSFLVHNDAAYVGSREILRNAAERFAERVKELAKAHPYVYPAMGLQGDDEIEDVTLTMATELEFWVKTPEDKGDREQLSTSQELKEQYWQRTRGAVRTALEKAILLLEKYDFGTEMGHKEVGGIKAKLDNAGEYTHIMEQLEIDWAYDDALQSADNELFIKYLIKDVFRTCGLEVTFMAKPIDGVAGSGEHTHLGAIAKLKSGKAINLFAPGCEKKDFLSPVGYGALMGLLKNYEAVNPFVASTNDALNRLKPGFEAPVCIVTSLGHSVDMPSRNRTVLAGLVRDLDNPLSVRFELRSPCPKCNTYLVTAAAYLAMLDGIEAALGAEKTSEELEKAISKERGEEAFYLERDRAYRSEEDVFVKYDPVEREELFGDAPATVWENISAFRRYPDKLSVLKNGDVLSDKLLNSYEAATVAQWATELQNRLIPDAMSLVRSCVKSHTNETGTDLDEMLWREIEALRDYLAKDTIEGKCLLTRIKNELSDCAYEAASNLQIEMQKNTKLLRDTYLEYKRNIL
ncbi:MAG: glutamine synthetase [Clostridiales Family XIII bacterium]|jgi:glutamine synthetase|nr:glutamine synthetase [Clostridiales Family XIII bacterium]